MRGIPNAIVDKASRFVQRNARYHPFAPKKPYTVRWPKTATASFCADDTWELVEQVARAMNRKEKSRASK